MTFEARNVQNYMKLWYATLCVLQIKHQQYQQYMDSLRAKRTTYFEASNVQNYKIMKSLWYAKRAANFETKNVQNCVK